jgi:hypothetical protein
MLVPLPEVYTDIAILQYYENVNSQMVSSAETGLFAIAAAMSGFVRFGRGGLVLLDGTLKAAVSAEDLYGQGLDCLLLAPDEGCRAPGPCCGKPALDIPRRQDAPSRHRLGEPPEVRCPQILEVEVIAASSWLPAPR